MESVIQRDPTQVYSFIDNEIVMLSLNEGQYFALNEVASKIWTLIDKPIKVKSLITLLLADFDVERKECESDTLSCIKDFEAKSLLKEITR